MTSTETKPSVITHGYVKLLFEVNKVMTFTSDLNCYKVKVRPTHLLTEESVNRHEDQTNKYSPPSTKTTLLVKETNTTSPPSTPPTRLQQLRNKVSNVFTCSTLGKRCHYDFIIRQVSSLDDTLASLVSKP